jgi:phosphoribosyl 1,2-cyclic phosphodiesterase
VQPEPTPPPSTRLYTLGSGSKGNAAVVAHGTRLLMLDAGFELPELVARLHAAGLHPWDVEDVVLSHGHRDHVLGAAHGARVYGWRLWGSLGTVWRWRALREVPLRPLEPGAPFDAGAFVVHTAATPHDVDDSAAVVVETRATGARTGYVTDLGHAPEPVVALLAGVHALVLEANHDPAMLRAGPYPPEVRERVAGPIGHLSNAQAADVARAVAHAGLRHLVLGHVSRHNNTPELARAAVAAALAGTAFRGALHVAPQDAVLGPLVVDRPDAGAGGGGSRRD